MSFTAGVAAALLACRLEDKLPESVMSAAGVWRLALPILMTSFFGGSLWGAYLIPLAAASEGFLLTVSAWTLREGSLGTVEGRGLVLYAIVAVPILFFLGCAGLRCSGELRRLLAVAGRRTEQDHIRFFMLRAALALLMLALCFFLNGGM